MPGKLNLGLDAISPGTQAQRYPVANAYCEGRGVAQAGGVEGDNPFADAKDESFIAWAEGFSEGLILDEAARGGCAR